MCTPVTVQIKQLLACKEFELALHLAVSCFLLCFLTETGLKTFFSPITLFHNSLSVCLMHSALCLPIDSIMRLMTIWRIRGKIVRTAITVVYTYSESAVVAILGLGHFCVLCSI